MKVYHIAVVMDEGWYCVRALEDPGVYTQGRTLDEVVQNVREVVELLYGEKEIQLELLLPAAIRVGSSPARSARGDKPPVRRAGKALR